MFDDIKTDRNWPVRGSANMEWNFNSPGAPHMGMRARLVGCVKVALKNIVKEHLVTDFQLMTLLTEI